MIEYLSARIKITKTCGCNVPGICPCLREWENDGHRGPASPMFLSQICKMLNAHFLLEMLNILVSACENEQGRCGWWAGQHSGGYSLFFLPKSWVSGVCSLLSPLYPRDTFPYLSPTRCISATREGTTREENTCQVSDARGCRSCALRGPFTLSLGTDACGLMCACLVPCSFLFPFSHPFLN